MHIDENIMLLMAGQRVQDAERRAEEWRALRLARPPRPPSRVLLGMALVRLGHWIMGQASMAPGSPMSPRQTQS